MPEDWRDHNGPSVRLRKSKEELIGADRFAFIRRGAIGTIFPGTQKRIRVSAN
jgi:hypothetical protein